MCGGAPKADKPLKNAPTPAPPPELLLDPAGQAERNKRKKVSTARSGRTSLVTPGLSLGSAAARAATGALGLGAKKQP